MQTIVLEQPPARGSLFSALALLRERKTLYLLLNLIYFGFILSGMLFAASAPEARQQLWEQTQKAVVTGPLAPLAEAYTGAHFFKAVAVTFLVNLIVGSLLYINVTSAVVPFIGLLLVVWRAILWGLLFCPLDHPLGWGVWLHYGTLLLEGQAYVIAACGAYLQGEALIAPGKFGASTPGAGYRAGIACAWRLYPLVALVLFVAAIYEAALGIYVLPHIVPH